jgi:hypothetical protein
MKFFAALAFVLPVVSALAPTSTTKRAIQLNPDVESLSPKVPVSESPVPTPETNAQRLARGLNPLSPRHLRRSKTSRGRFIDLASRVFVSSSSHSQPPPPIAEPPYSVSSLFLVSQTVY